MRKQKSERLPLFEQASRNHFLEMQRKIDSSNVVRDEKALRWLRSEHAYYQGAIYKRYTNPDGSMGGTVAIDAKIDSSATVSAGAIVHSMAEIGRDSEISRGVIIYSRARIGIGVKIMEDSIVGFGTAIGDGASIGQSVSVENGVAIGVRAKLGAYSSVYSGAIIRDDEGIRPHSMVLPPRK